MSTEQQVIEGIIRRDEQIIRDFVRLHQNYVYTLCLRILTNEMLAEEATQDTFLQVIQSMDKFDGRSRLTTWMYTIARNTSINKLRKTNRSRVKSLDQTELAQQPHEDTSEKPLLQKQQREQLECCMQKLPIEERETLTLFYFKELSIREIGEITGDTESNIKVKLHRGRKHLKTILEASVHGQIDLLYG